MIPYTTLIALYSLTEGVQVSAAHRSTSMTARWSNFNFLFLQLPNSLHAKVVLCCSVTSASSSVSIVDPGTQKLAARLTEARSSIPILIQAHSPGSVDRQKPSRANSMEKSESILVSFQGVPAATKRSSAYAHAARCLRRNPVHTTSGRAAQHNDKARARRGPLTQVCPVGSHVPRRPHCSICLRPQE